MNAAVMTYGWAVGGRGGAKQALADFWHRVSDAASMGLLQPSWFDRAVGNHSLSWSPVFPFLDLMTRVFSPYQFNPLNYNPVRDLLIASIDFEVLRKPDCPIKLFLSATNVRTGKVKVFANEEISTDSILASACLPQMFQAVEVDGEHYWDGGYMGNPALFPLIYSCRSPDILIVHINPIARAELPQTASEILNRVNEISFNATLMREMRAIHFVNRLIDSGQLEAEDYKRTNIHLIEAADEMKDLHASSKLNADPELLDYLFRLGRSSAEQWIAAHFDKLGVSSSIDVAKTYL